MPPPVQMGERIEPARARPVPFWRHGLAPPPRTWPRVLVDAVPWRRAASSARAHSHTRPSFHLAPKTSSSSSTALPPPSGFALAIGPHLHDAALGAGRGAAHQQKVPVSDDLDDLEPLLGDALAAHPAGAADALEHARGRGRRADRARGAHVVRAVADGAAGEVVALDRSLEALALRDAGDLDGLAGLERLDGDLVADRQLACLVAELRDVAQRRSRGLLEVPELRLGQVLLLGGTEGKLHSLVAVALLGADRGHVARAGLENGDALDAA